MGLFLWLIFSLFMWVLRLDFIEYQVLGFIILMIFVRNMLWVLVLWFELILIPILYIIFSAGLNPARVSATIYMLFYTLLFSLPLLFFVVSANYYALFYSVFSVSWVVGLWLIFSFGVKVPMYGLHLWLPKAHVEASTLGSIILAGALLKGGTYGVFFIFYWLCLFYRVLWFLLGSVFAVFIATIQSDIKKLLAYRRVIHLNLGLVAYFSGSILGAVRFVLVRFTHGLVRRTLFYLGGVSSLISRVIYFLKGHILLVWFVVLFANIGLPPFLAFVAEAFLFVSLLTWSLWGVSCLVVGGIFIIWLSIKLWLNLRRGDLLGVRGVGLLLTLHWVVINLFWLIL